MSNRPFSSPAASVGDRVWIDLNGNGIQDAGEPGVGGVTVKLVDSNGNVVATTITDANGFYNFPNVTPGTYTVMFTLPDGFEFTAPNQGGDNELNSKVTNFGTGSTDPFTVGAGQRITNIDAGLKRGVGLCGCMCMRACVWGRWLVRASVVLGDQ